MKKYSVGQVVYVILSAKNAVYPVQIAEVITRQTLAGEQTSYKVKTSQDESMTDLDSIQGEMFESLESVKKILIQRTLATIDKLVSNAAAKAEEWYPGSVKKSSDQDGVNPADLLATSEEKPGKKQRRAVMQTLQQTNHGQELDDQATYIKMPNGDIVKANIKLPESMVA